MLDLDSRVLHRSQESSNVLVDGVCPTRCLLNDLASWVFIIVSSCVNTLQARLTRRLEVELEVVQGKE